jgi:hypothetical protein
MKKCPDCDSEKIIQNAKAIDRGESNVNLDLCVAVDEAPEAFIFKKRVYSEVDADVCGECGFIQFYAKNPEILWTAYENQQVNSIIDDKIKRRKDL